ncbi:MAG TPA: hypothetical protein O0X25_04205 [Methanocorpusculum sp.]|nr:hypothetical protein [Methanocorpusculum sp.]HJJ40483.1 hypothetical protein [Methanocorpusculum sp.]HJJ49802.1 hypothetical protein [Methanocorpusculum sp.]HJJ57361.1 hypothetical protein [Methanocorpusculum sp.]
MTTVKETEKFLKDLKSIVKKHPEFSDHYSRIVKIALSKLDKVPDIVRADRISGLGEKYAQYPVYKLRVHKCAKMRLIYYRNLQENTVVLLEAYCKNQQETENRSRIYDYLDSLAGN